MENRGVQNGHGGQGWGSGEYYSDRVPYPAPEYYPGAYAGPGQGFNMNQSSGGGQPPGFKFTVQHAFIGVAIFIVALIAVVIGSSLISSTKSFTASGTIHETSGHLNDGDLGDYTDLMNEMSESQGKGPYVPKPSCTSDNFTAIEEGDQITISDSSGKTVGTGLLEFVPEESKEGNWEVIGDYGYCVFRFEIPNVKSGDELFHLSISNQPGKMPTVSRDDLKNGIELTASTN